MKDPELVEKIAAADPERAAILRTYPADVVTVPTPFYRNVRVVDLDVDTGMGHLRFRYGLEGDRTVALGERPEAVYELNERDGLVLGQETARRYVRFFFDSVGGRKMRIVESPEEIPWRPRKPDDPRPPLTKPDVRPVTVESSPGRDFRAVACALWGAMLVEVTLEVSATGKISPTSQRPLADRLDILPT
ncbi:MAG TPA: hypothetical protein VLH41_06155 [Thermoanaerobaculia bacterium]|nr:hypothetical protein [Thermoanaerobaculia bacterium]